MDTINTNGGVLSVMRHGPYPEIGFDRVSLPESNIDKCGRPGPLHSAKVRCLESTADRGIIHPVALEHSRVQRSLVRADGSADGPQLSAATG
ncbi:hypothetical protein AFLA_013350 [Aspergillus flavus NRRL3357]|nr:hypothetical protein AFLA_013350 [Aspergillus flavus NRRL3357]